MKHRDIPQMTDRQVARFWSKVNRNGECWLWTGAQNREGYGYFSLNNSDYYAHRVSFAIEISQIPPDNEVDHICRNTSCVRPSHLRAVRSSVNSPHASKTACPKGHPFDEKNTRHRRGRRECRTCIREQLKAQWKRGTRKHGPNNGNG